MSQSAIQKPSLKPQTASSAGIEAQWSRKNSLERLEPRKKPREEPGSEGWPVFWLCRVEIIRVHGHKGQIVLQDVQTFIDDQQGKTEQVDPVWIPSVTQPTQVTHTS
jgi:hypothetical protein